MNQFTKESSSPKYSKLLDSFVTHNVAACGIKMNKA